jgi:peptidoglycan hydrolase CwlO-like protein
MDIIIANLKQEKKQ